MWEKAVRGEEGDTGEATGVPGVGVLDWEEYPLEGEARRCSSATGGAAEGGVSVRASSSEPLEGRSSDWGRHWGRQGLCGLCSGCSAEGAVWRSETNGSKVETVPQVRPLCRL